MAGVIAFGIYIVVIAELSVDTSEKSTECGILLKPVARLEDIRGKSLELLPLSVMMFAIGGCKPY